MALSDSLQTLRISALDFDAQIRTAITQAESDIGIPEGSVVVPVQFLRDILSALEDLSEGGEAYIEGASSFDSISEDAADAAASAASEAASSAAYEAVRDSLRDADPNEDAYVAGEADPYAEARPIRAKLEDALARIENGSPVEDRAIDSF